MTCEPSGVVAEVPAGTTLFDAVRGAGLPLAASCPAEGVCARCGVRVVEGADALSRETAFERELKSRNGVPGDQRIACLARVKGAVRVSATYW